MKHTSNRLLRHRPLRWAGPLMIGLALASGGCAATVSAAQPVYVAEAPPPQRTVVVRRPARPYAGAVWVEGHWRWTGHRYVWAQGHWVRPRRGYVWVQPRWERRGRQYVYVRGAWRAAPRGRVHRQARPRHVPQRRHEVRSRRDDRRFQGDARRSRGDASRRGTRSQAGGNVRVR